MSKSPAKNNMTWKTVMMDAFDGNEVRAKLVKLAETSYKAAESKVPADMIPHWEGLAEATAEWILSDEAGAYQILEMEDIPEQWLRTVGEVTNALRAGVDLTKVKNHHQMVKMTDMLRRQKGEDVEETPAKDSAIDVAQQTVKDAETALEKAKRLLKSHDEEEEDGEDEATEEDGDEEEHPEEPEKGKEPPPKPKKKDEEEEDGEAEDDVPYVRPDVTDEDIAFAAKFIDSCLASGQALDADKLVIAPQYLLKSIAQMEEMSEGMREKCIKGINTLVGTQYGNWRKGIQEGERRKAAAQRTIDGIENKKKQEALAKKKGKQTTAKPTLVLPADKNAKGDNKQHKRGKKEDSASFDRNKFASLIG